MNTSHSLFQNPALYGIQEDSFVRLDKTVSAEQAAYLDLLQCQDLVGSGLAVIENQGNALLYVLPAEALSANQNKLRDWLNVLACRGDARYLAVAHPGRLDFYTLHLRTNGEVLKPAHQNVLPNELHSFLIGAWVNNTPHDQQKDADQKWLETLLFNLLFGAAKALHEKEKQLTPDQVLSLVGRALFIRYVADRGILKNQDVAAITQSLQAKTWTQLFASAQTLAHTCTWLDKTFNGNLLPVIAGGEEYPSVSAYQVFFEQHANTHAILSDVLKSASGGQMELGWQDIQFQHVPADMLSQVYEQFAHKFQSHEAKNTSIYYTPRHIAQQLVNAAFAGSTLEDKSLAHVLDPSVGAGVFLVLAYKRLFKERWKKIGQQPKRKELRAILNDQLCGLDINAQSLKFAALSLYLTALELDPDPQPLTDLKFKPLSQRVLLYVGGKEFNGLGSLHGYWSEGDFHQRFDMVVGNPPWTKPKDPGKGVVKVKIESYTKVVRECAERAGVPLEMVRTLKADQGNPDPVFVWRSLSWAKPNGMLAFALHAQHILFQKGASYAMRNALLGCVELTGVVNGSDLRKTEIWPSQTAPFCLWIARNRSPDDGSYFYYLNPYAETALSERQQYRLDPKDAQVVSQNIVRSSPDAFKVLSKCGELNLSLVDRIRIASGGDTLEKYWSDHSLVSSAGCKPNEGKDENAALFDGMPFLTSEYKERANSLHLDGNRLPKFLYEFPIDRARDQSVYKAPLVLFVESPFTDATHLLPYGVGAFSSMEPLIYNYSFYGYSCAGHAQPKRLARYLQLLSVSSVLSYFALATSPKFGVERETLQKEDIDQFPFIPLENLASELKDEILNLSAKLLASEKPWAEINEWARKIYKLSKPDMQVIEDTLRIAWPRNSFADKRPTPAQFKEFEANVQRVMQPFADIAEVPLQVLMCDADETSGWAFVKVAFVSEVKSSTGLPDNWQMQLAAANQFWASQVKIYADESQQIVYIGQLARNRYWTQTRARMLAMDLLNNDLEQHGKFPHHAQSQGGH